MHFLGNCIHVWTGAYRISSLYTCENV